MKEHPILFSTPMVQAILEGRKTQTRRVIKPQPDEEPYFANKTFMWYAENKPKGLSDCPYGEPGDLLWVRETTIRNNNSNTYWPVADGYVKTADYEKTIPSIHMPKDAARIWLKVKDVRVERLESISSNDAKAEGIDYSMSPIGFCGWDYQTGGYNAMTTPYHSFMSLWRKVHGIERYGKTGNPWVWVITFEELSRTGRPEPETFPKVCLRQNSEL